MQLFSRSALLFSTPFLLASLAAAGTQYRVTITGEVEFNGVSSGPLSMVSTGESTELTFLVDEDVFVNSGSFPTRGYAIDPSSWSFSFDLGSLPLQSPYPGTPYFVLRDNDPAVDGFFVADNVNFPTGVATAIPGGFGQFVNNFSVAYGGSDLSSLDISGAVGTYDFTGLSVFNWTIDDGPFNAMGILFEELKIAEVAAPVVSAYGCTNPVDSLTHLGGAARIGETFELGVDNPLGTQAAGSSSFVIAAIGAAPGFPCGIALPGLGMAGAGAAGELLVSLTGAAALFSGSPWGGPGLPATVSVGIPFNPVLVGVPVYFQGLLFDPVAASGVSWGLTSGIEAVIGND